MLSPRLPRLPDALRFSTHPGVGVLWVGALVFGVTGLCLSGGKHGRIAALQAKRAPVEKLAEMTRVDLPDCGMKAHHAAHLVEGADGSPILFWFAGSREGATNVCIMRARYSEGAWKECGPVLDAATVSRLSRRWVRKLGNTVAWRGGDGRLHLYVTTVTVGGWSGSRIIHLVSPDDGATFASAEALMLSPFFNFSTLVKSPAFGVAGAASLPVYHEFMYKRPLLLGLDEHGSLLSANRMGDTAGLLQPAVTRLADGSYLSCLRTTGAYTQHVYTQTSEDGSEWSDPVASALFNPGAAVALATLPDGRPVMAYNDAQHDRLSLRLAVADASGAWHPVGPVFRADKEYSYPTLLTAGDALHLAFTRERRGITHLRIPFSVFDSPAVRPALGLTAFIAP